jgi:hypothetical protein
VILIIDKNEELSYKTPVYVSEYPTSEEIEAEKSESRRFKDSKKLKRIIAGIRTKIDRYYSPG